MKFYKPKATVLVQVYTFEEVVHIGRALGVPCYGEKNMPWSFNINGFALTHENDEMYIFGAGERFTPDDVLVFFTSSQPEVLSKTKLETNFEMVE